jgi:AcrR family transcriptional regulator
MPPDEPSSLLQQIREISMPALTKKRTSPRPSDEEAVGLREKNKIDKLQRIKAAARELFIARGFDDTTTREIAVRAGVGIGTVFIYADNKRDLLFLVANDELAETTSKAEGSVRDDASCLQNLLTVFRDHYEFFGRQPELSRLMLREMIFYDSGRQADRFQATRDRVIKLVGAVMKQALDREMIRSSEDSSFIGWVAFCIFQVELRRWLMTKEPDIDKGIEALQRALQLFIKGLAPAKDCLAVSKPSRHLTRRVKRSGTN